jgi:hypothetical protein
VLHAIWPRLADLSRQKEGEEIPPESSGQALEL